jgi:glutaminyl-tRNA synthetase
VPRQIEFARLNLTYVVLSKRKLIQLVDESTSPAGTTRACPPWSAPAAAASRRRLPRFAERIGVSKADSWIDMSVLEDCMREHLNEAAERRVAVLDPLKLIITNYPEGHTERCHAPNHPLHPELGKREMPFGRELWIEREDFMETPVKGYHRLYPGNMARLRYGYVVKCTGCEKDADGNITAVLCEYMPDSSPARRRRQLQGQGQPALGVRGPRLHRRGAPLRPPVRPRLPGQPARGRPESWSATSSTTSTRTA